MLISLACVSSETRNLQRVFRPGAVFPFIGCIGMCRAKRFLFFSRFGLNRPFWSETRYGLCPLVLNRVCFLEEFATSSFGDKTISLLMFTPTTVYVP